MRFIGLSNVYSISKIRLLLVIGALLWAVIGIDKPALADSLPTSGTCTLLEKRTIPPPRLDSKTRIVDLLLAINFDVSPPVVGYNAVEFSWNKDSDHDKGGITQDQGVLSDVTITPNTLITTPNPLAGNTYVLSGTTAKGAAVQANLVPVHSSNTILIQIYSPSVFSGACQMQ